MLCVQENEITVLDQDVAAITEEIRAAEEVADQAKEEVATVESNIAAIQDRIDQQIGEVESLSVSGVAECVCEQSMAYTHGSGGK